MKTTLAMFRIDESVIVDGIEGVVSGSRFDDADNTWIYNVFRPTALPGHRDIEALEHDVKPVSPRMVRLTSKKNRRWTGIAVCNDGRIFEVEDIRRGDAMAGAYYAAKRAGVLVA